MTAPGQPAVLPGMMLSAQPTDRRVRHAGYGSVAASRKGTTTAGSTGEEITS
jgi:hypothetical protein